MAHSPASFRAFLLLAASLAAARHLAAQAPPVRFTTEEAFDAAKVPAYAGRHDAVYAHIDANVAAHLEQLQRWVRQHSVSAQDRGIREMAELLAGDLRALGFQEVELVPTTGHPGVWGYYDAGAAKTLAIYLMYDVQPEESGWSVKAFEGAVVERPLGKVLMARGATNQKGPERAFFNALDSIRKTRGKPPVNLMVVAEGEEELGSPNFGQVVDRFEARLKTAHGVFFPMNSQDPTGGVSLPLGVKGILSMELTARGGPQGGPKHAEIHSSLKAIVDAPAWRLAHALGTLTTPDGNTILVPGYYDAIRQPNAEEQRLVNGMLKTSQGREEVLKRSFGVDRFISDLKGRELLAQWLFTTTININGLFSGYAGEGMKTILPHVATVRLDSRLVPNQKPAEQLDLIKKHLVAKGFADIEVKQLSGYPPAQSSVEDPFVRAVIGVFNKHGVTPSVAPRLAGSAPYYIFTDRLRLPMVIGGLGHGAGAHAPDEYMVIEPKAGSRIAGLAALEKYYVDVLYALAEAAR
jgi:acetylornithine deacetylase/succinyl-diaminopimelate desuccinylase-like protein